MAAAAGATVAVLDVGSNSVLLLTAALGADGRLRAVDAALETTRLGAGLADGGRLDPAARGRTRDAVVAFAARARARGAGRIWAFATGAARRAADGGDFAAETAGAAGCPLEVLSGEREARLAYAAVAAGLDVRGWLLVADVGGATTELTLGEGARIDEAASLALGALALTERWAAGDGDGHCAQAVETVRAAAVDAVLAGTPLSGRARARGATLAASGGTATALAAVDLGLAAYDPARVHGHVLAAGRLGALAARGRTRAGVLDHGRARILPAGALVLARVAAAAGAERVLVSDHAVRHAYLLERLAGDGAPVAAEAAWA